MEIAILFQFSNEATVVIKNLSTIELHCPRVNCVVLMGTIPNSLEILRKELGLKSKVQVARLLLYIAWTGKYNSNILTEVTKRILFNYATM